METICKLEKVQKSFQDKIVFKDFSMEVKKGDFVCLAGPSGSGKSTILNLIGMFEQADGGKIELFGESLPHMTSRKGKEIMRDKIFYIFQNFALVDDKSIYYNLSIPLIYSKKSKQEKQKEMQNALESVGLQLPLSKKIYQLSGGEQQRVAIARAFLRNFELILADEPTGSLDSGNKRLIMNILKQFNKEGKTIIMVSHDEEIINDCLKVVRLS
ncbi:MAG: putative bacteriocin export ABC transporter [Lachnospiraceae bacterium]|nr:putative bacteriocin export ABC transporter [Lachnospiraceae bacterium]